MMELVQTELETDSRRSWLMCFINFFTGFVCFGIHCNFGLLHRWLILELRNGSAVTAWLGSLAFGLTFFMSPLSNAFCEVMPASVVSFAGASLCIFGLVLSSFATNIAVLYVTYSLCFGIGASLAYFPTVIILKKYFKRYLTLANGLSASGSGLGTFALAPLIELILERAGITWTYRLLTAIAASMLTTQAIFVCIEKRNKDERERPKVNKRQVVERLKQMVLGTDLWSDPKYIVMVAAMAVFLFGYFIPYVHLVYLATEMGISTRKATFLISYLSVSSTIGKVIFGFFINFFRLQVRLVTAFSMFCIGLGNFLIPFGETYASLCVYSITCGLMEGCINGQIAVTVLETVGSARMSQGLANLLAVNAILMMAGPPVAGFIYDTTQSYDMAFYLSGSTCTLGATAMLILSIVDRKSSKSSETLSIEDLDNNRIKYDLNSLEDHFFITLETSV